MFVILNLVSPCWKARLETRHAPIWPYYNSGIHQPSLSNCMTYLFGRLELIGILSREQDP